MATDPFAHPGSELFPSMKPGTSHPPASDVFAKPATGYPSGGTGGGGSAQAGKRASEIAKQKLLDQQWDDEHEAAIRNKNNTYPEPVKLTPRIANPRFEGENFHIRDEVTVQCDCFDGAWKSCVQFELQGENEAKEWVSIIHFSGCGKAVTLYPVNSAMESKPTRYKLIAKYDETKSYESEPIEVQPATEFHGIILYSLQRGEYLVLDTPEDAAPWLEAVQETEALSTALHQAIRDPKPESRWTAIQGVAEKAEKLFGGKAQSKGEGLEELLQVGGNWRDGKMRSLIHIASHDNKGNPVTGYWRNERDATVKKKLEKALRTNAKDRKPNPWWKSKLKYTLVSSEYKEGQWPITWKKSGEKDAHGEIVNWSPEAATCRFVAGFAGADLELDPAKGTVKLSTSGEMAFSFFEGKIGGKWKCPDYDGVNLLELLGKVKYLSNYIKKGRECRLRFSFEFSSKAFVGLSASGAINVLTLDISSLKGPTNTEGPDKTSTPKPIVASSGAKASVFAGAEAGVAAKVVAQWSAYKDCFTDLGEAGYEFSGIAGAAGELKLQIEYKDGKFYMAATAALAIGLGIKKGFKYVLSQKEGVKFIGHLLYSVDCHTIAEITGEAYKAYKNLCFIGLTQGLKAIDDATEAAIEQVEDFGLWLNKAKATVKKYKAVIYERSQYPQVNRTMAPEALGHAMATIMVTREATDFKALIWFLQSAESSHKVRWVVRFASEVNIPMKSDPFYKAKKDEAYEVGRKKLMDFGNGIGYEGTQQNPNEPFKIELREILHKAEKYEVD
jgi:hypothetical protein